MRLMDAATEPYGEHAGGACPVPKDLDTARASANGRPRTEITTEQGVILLNADGDLHAGILTRWKEESSTLNDVYISGKKERAREAFNTIIELESGK